MWDLLSTLYFGAVMLSNIVLYASADYPTHTTAADRESVTAVSTFREWWREDGKGKCQYTGVMVPYVRDWEEIVHYNNHDEIRPAEPNKTAGQAFIINKKNCEGKVPEAVLRIGARPAPADFSWGSKFVAQDLGSMKPEDRPKWFNQVWQRVERVAQHDTQAKEFLDFTSTTMKAANEEKTARANTAASAPASSIKVN